MKVSVRSTVDLLVLGGAVVGVELALKEKCAGHSVLLATPFSYFGDDVCATMDFRNIPDFLRQNGVKGVPSPMQVKYTLDRLMVDHGVPFVLQTMFLGFSGTCAILADRAGVYAVRTRAIVDTTPLLTAARLSQMPFATFTPGKTKALCRALTACAEADADYVCEGRPYQIETLETEVELDGLEPEAYFRAEIAARLKVWKNTHVYVADRVEFESIPAPVGMDPEHFVFTVSQYKEPLLKREELSCETEVTYEPARSVSFDIAITGGGTAGATAGIPGGKAGLKTLVIERLSHLGGIATSGCITKYWYGLKIGYTKVLDEQVKAKSLNVDGAPYFPETPVPIFWEVAVKENVFESENSAAGVSVWFESSSCGVEAKDGTITGLLVATPFGGILVQAQQFIDCTGNAELAYRLGAPTEYSSPDEPAVQGAGMSAVVPGNSCYNTDYMFIVDSDPRDTERAFLTGRDHMRQQFDLAQLPGTRERRRIVGEVVLAGTDFYACRSYPDTILLARSNFDTHGFTVDPLFIYHPTDETPFIAEIPFRALLSPGVANLMTTGLGISARRDAMPLIRMIADVQNQGYAAGLIAAEAVLTKRTLRNVDLPVVQKRLREMGFLTPDVETPKSELNPDAVIFAAPDLAALEKEYQAQPDFEKAIRLAFLGSSLGVELLKDKIASTAWDNGWNYTGMGQFGRATSRMDAAILALAGCCSDSTFLMPRLAEMTPSTHFSHYRSVCFFLMKHPAKEAATELNRLLHCFQCHAVADWRGLMDSRYTDNCDVEERNLQLRELYLAGALHACDPSNELAKYFLEQYQKGVHRLYAIYAEKWGNGDFAEK